MPEEAAATIEPLTQTVARPSEETDQQTKRQPPYHVILWNDDDHTYEYVIVMLMKLFGHPPEKGFLMAQEVDAKGG